MLQQTQVDTVIPYFERFIEKYPDIASLSRTDQETLYKTVEGLGYYRRFHHLLVASKKIVEMYGNQFPDQYEEVLALPGVGKYTAGAIMSIAYNQPFAATDGNVIRVLSRYHAVESDMRIEKNRLQIHRINQSLIEQATPHIYTQAIMELGALICTPRNPLCEKCVLKNECLAYRNSRQNDLPIISSKPKQKVLHYITFVIENDRYVHLRKRKEKLLGGMYEFPQYESDKIEEALLMAEKEGYRLKAKGYLGDFKHTFTHQIWLMDVYRVELLNETGEKLLKIQKTEFDQVPMAKAHRNICDHI